MIPDHDRSGMKNEVLQSGECVMETSGKVNEMVESAGYTMEAFGNMSSHGEYDTGTG